MIETEKDMKRAAKALEFEEAAMWRDQLAKLRQQWSSRYGSQAEAAMKRQASAKSAFPARQKESISGTEYKERSMEKESSYRARGRTI